ncbi:WD repeat-containing protein 35, partial [Asbolus verrucosus]
IAIPNNTKINAIAWNKEDGYIAVGGEDGLLKVLKLDAGGENETGIKSRGLAASSNLSMNQTLEGHTENIQVLVWNEAHKKLTTSDQNGVIIVWMMYKGAWYEEMINNRKKSTVVGMAWSADGLKICIIYEDGAVIVGSVDGNRIWGKELKNIYLSGVQWSPDGKLLLFSLKNGQVHLYDNQGNFTMQIEIFCNEVMLELIPVVGLDWYNGQNGHMHALCPNLAICYENGRAQIMRNESDTSKYIDIEPIAVAMNSSHVIVTSKNNFVVWQYKTPKSSSVTGARAKCKMFHVDDNPTGAVEVIQDLDNSDKVPVSTHSTLDPACCITCSDKCLIIGRESGLLQYYALPHVVLTNRYKISSRPHKISINCNSTRLSVIDVAGVMTVLDISEGVGRPSTTSEGNKLERKDVWAMCWASDNPQLLAIMEKTRMYIFKGVYPEEPVSCSGYICSFNDLEIQAVLLDEIMESPERPNNKDHLIKLEVKSLRDTRQLLEKVGINEASLFIDENPHPRLWRLLAEAALKEMNLPMAESAFVRSRDYSRVLFVKKLKDINSEAIRKARIATYFKNFDEAEKIYMEADRSDLALNLRQILGDWFRVIQILKNGASAPDYLLKTAYNSTADYFVNFNNWATAVEYYEFAGNRAEMIECFYHLEDYKKLESFIQTLPEGDSLLEKIGDMFAANAVNAEAFGNINAAIDLCILHNRWDTAIDLAKKFNITKISDLFIKYTTHLEEQGSLLAAIDVNIQAKFYLHAAEHAFKLANQESKKSDKNLLKVKKHYVYAAHLLQMHKKTPNPAEWASDSMIYENAWKGAEAYHYFMLGQEQLYSGKLHDALCTANKLQDYVDYIDPNEIYSLLALTACLDRSFAICSKALIKLKTLPELSQTTKTQYTKLAWDIFTKNEPKDLKQNKENKMSQV